MDFHSLARRDLQALCKRNKIPANQTNVAMADALQALQSIEWDEEIRQKLMPQSAPIEQQHGSPLPRSRRISAVPSDISIFPSSDELDETKKEETLTEAIRTPATAVRRSQRIQSAARTSAAIGTGTRARRGKKDEAAAAAVMVETPAPVRGRKKAAMETPAPVPRSSARPTRQSVRKVTRTLDADDCKEDRAEVNEVPETEQAKEEQQLAADEKLDLVEQNVEQIVTESVEEIVAEESEISAALPVSEEKYEIPLENSTGTDESEKGLEEQLTSEITDQKEVPTEKSVEDIAPISEEEQVNLEEKEKEDDQVHDETAPITDSPIMGLVSEINSDITLDAQEDAPPCDIITPNAQDDIITPDMSLASPVRAQNDVGVERMLESVVRRFAKASINSAKKTDNVVVVEPLESAAQNENAVKEKKGDLQNMSLRKLKAMYKDRLIELNSKKVVAEEGKRLPLGNLDENIQGNMMV